MRGADMSSSRPGSTGHPGSHGHRGGSGPADTVARAGDTGEKRSGRRPEGPPHERKGSMAQTAKRTLTEFKEDNLSDAAASLTYRAVLSIFPALVAMIALVSLVADPQVVTRQLTTLVSSIGPPSAAQTFREPISSLANGSSATGILLVVGVAAALWTASGYVAAFMRASNTIYEVEEGRSYIKLRPLQILVTLILVILLALVLVALVVTGPVASKVGSAIGAGPTAVTVWDIVKWPVLIIIVIFMIAVLYYAAPNARLRGLKSIMPGALLALVIWLIASLGFAYYVANFGSYNKTYGTLGGAIALLVWLWISNAAILLGAEVNAERERSRQLRGGTPGAERELQLQERSAPKQKKRSRTA
jgi:membrane protein